MANIDQDKVQFAKNKIKEKLQEYGSVELMANLAIKEMRDQSFLFHNPCNPMGENPFVAYSLGLFLSNNNLDAGEPHPTQIDEFIVLLTQYFNQFRFSLTPEYTSEYLPKDSIAFQSQLHKIVDDGNSNIYPHQKDDYYQQVFFPLNDYFVSQFGFSVQDAVQFIDVFLRPVNKHMQNRYELSHKKYCEFKEQLAKPETAPLLEQYKKNNIESEKVLSFYTDAIFFADSKDILVIKVDDYCDQQKITNKKAFRNYLNTFSCTFGEQFENFESPLSDNIIFHKPIIKLDDNTFFLPKYDFLRNRLDRLLEYVLEKEKQSHSEIWNKFVELKSAYLENKAAEYFSRIFPEKHLFKNLYYWIGHDRMEIDLLVMYDNKIFVVESKSGNLPLSAKRDGREQLRTRLTDLIEKALSQATRSRNYIQTHSKARFWNESKDKMLLEIDSSNTNYQFFFVNVTLESLGGFAAGLKDIESFGFFKDGEYPWSVYLYDLDVVTSLLQEPIYFIHYLEQRMEAQKQNIFSSPSELILLGYYLKFGNFYQQLAEGSEYVHKIGLFPDYVDPIDKHYLYQMKKPQLEIPKELEILLLNMQKYHQKGFTDVTSLLLDFPYPEQNRIAKLLKKKTKHTIKTGLPSNFNYMLEQPVHIGFSYFASNSMANFYKRARIDSKTLKHQYKTARWATIGRNVMDRKNLATFFLYDDMPCGDVQT